MNQKLFKSKFVKDTLRLLSGTIISQGALLLTTPLITRLYQPEVFSASVVFGAILSIIVLCASLRYEVAILLPKEEEKSLAIVRLCIIITFTVTFLICLIILIFKNNLSHISKLSGIIPYLWFLPAIVFFQSCMQIFTNWNLRCRQFSFIAQTTVLFGIGGQVIKIGLGYYWEASVFTLMLANLLAVMIAVAWQQTKRPAQLFQIKNIDLELEMAKKYRKYPQVELWGRLLNVASFQLPILIMTVVFPKPMIAFYSLATAAIRAPMSLVGKSLANTYFQRITTETPEGVTRLTTHLFVRLFEVGILPTVILTIMGKDLFGLVFGEGWSHAGVLAQILTPYFFIVFISSPLSYLFISKNNLEGLFHFNLLLFFSRVGSILSILIVRKPEIAILIYSISGFAIYLFLTVKNLSMAKVKINAIVRAISGCSIEFLLGIGMFLAGMLLFGKAGPGVKTAISGISLVVYFGYVFLIKKE